MVRQTILPRLQLLGLQCRVRSRRDGRARGTSRARSQMSLVASTLKLAGAAVLALVLVPLPAQAQTTLRVPVVSRTIFYLPAWTAERQGFFKQEGLDVKMEVYDASEKIFHDLRAGTHQIGIASIESVIAESYKDGKLRIVAGIAKRPPHFIIAQPEIKTLADLK